ncbi:DUF4303 domain-containing protein [Acidovorax sp. sif1233]|uniref:DUF4303 domain-containing protein n=1 Tax=Acidovorax sp. sif1233 TaxID=2854792 RepID=UPI001C479C90|nr:DUF4303 domain-containing protein [Acidovorax sp. sif1233]MBV7457623.1 DUF4303 domain-containing protein [Acidovorax sp. sif1233]
MQAAAPQPVFSWDAFEQAFLDAALAVASAVLARHPEHRFYAVALAGMGRELDGPLFLPAIALNSEQAYAQAKGGGDDGGGGTLYSLRWNPADWRWPDLPADSPALARMQQELQAHACRGDVAHWRATEQQCLEALVRACQRLRTALRASPWSDRLTPDFAVLLHEDSDEGVQWARRCLGDDAFAALLPGHAAAIAEALRVEALPPDQQLRYHLACLRNEAAPELGLGRQQAVDHATQDTEHALRRLGPVAVPALLALLERADTQSIAARLLGDIGSASPEVLDALRHHLLRPVSRGSRAHLGRAGRLGCACALGQLGDGRWLLSQVGTLADDLVASGLAAPLGPFRDRCLQPRPLDYAPLEHAVLQHPALQLALQGKLAPGRGTCTLGPADVDEALRGLGSPMPLVRQHAAMALGDRALGSERAPRIVPALARAATGDAEETVRFLAVLGLGYWKQDAAHLRSLAQATAAHDPSDRVRDAARRWLEALDTHRAMAPTGQAPG